jgi:hypothetical protein
MLTIALSVGLVASVKRLWIGFFLGKKAFGKNKTTPLLLNIKLHFVFEISKPNPPEANYADDLATVMEKILLMSQVATLARKFERQFAFYGENLVHSPSTEALSGFTKDHFAGILASADDDDDDHFDGAHGKTPASPEQHQQPVSGSIAGPDLVINPEEKDRITGSLSQAQKMKIVELLGSWEEPEREKIGINVR